MPAMTRGPLPARVYWVRRLMVLGTAVLLVVALGRLLGASSDATSAEGGETATQVAAEAPAATGSTEPTTTARPKARKKRTRTPDPAPTLAVPVGECDGTDVAVTPLVKQAVAGRDVRIVLQLRTLETPACTWQVGPGSLTLDITSGPDDIWTSRECRRAIPREPVVVRQAVTSRVAVVWHARRSDEGCTRLTAWAMPGWYHVTAAALGGEPSDLQFQLTTPTAPVVTQTVTPTQKPSGKPSGKPGQKPSGKPSGKPSQKPSQKPSGKPSQKPSGSPGPSGAVEPNG